jgi:hypothetical protein
MLKIFPNTLKKFHILAMRRVLKGIGKPWVRFLVGRNARRVAA